jgi:myo-inositol-1(or 4)-monophosphatase
VTRTGQALVGTGAARLRALGSVALSLCFVAAGRFDALVTLSACRSVDAAAGQLIVREAGGAVAWTEADADSLGASLDIDMRSPLIAAASAELVERLRPLAAV